MAGHSKFSNIKHRKGAQDKKRAKIFTKLTREILTAAKQGLPDPASNPRLRTAIIAAKAQNLPKERIDAAIKKASTSGEGDNYDEMRYEGYGPAGVAFIVDALTDNRNRTAAEVRSIFTKAGGALGETGSVNFMFDRVGIVHYPKSVASDDEMFEAVIEAGAEDCESDETLHMIICDPDKLNEVQHALSERFGDAEVARLSWRPKITTDVDSEDKAMKVLKLIDALEDNDDVQYVSANFEIADEILEKIEL
jgi:YebC/PmpR family DNA-binding regulatory protein